MATKVVYFTVAGRKEQAEFRVDDSTEDVREIFQAAAEASPHDILKLYNTHGNIVNISAKLAENSPDTRYNLQVVGSQYGSSTSTSRINLSAMETRLEELERKILIDAGEPPDSVQHMKQDVEAFREKLESVEHLSWLGLFKDISSGTSLQPFWNKMDSIKRSPEHAKKVFDKYMKMTLVQVTDEIREYLKKPTFNNWQWDDAEMLILLRQMYIDLDLTTNFNIEISVLNRWLYEVYKHYNQVPFHNFKHCFMVAQMMYGLTWLIGLPDLLEPVEVLTLLTSAICHDLDHPGYNNAYQINARTELAILYNDISPLENHHCAVAFEILAIPECNIFKNLPKDVFKRIREGMIKCILATDMAKHNEILQGFKAFLPDFDFQSKEHKVILMMILVKMADISNEVRPIDVAEPWLECLLTEFFMQSDVEKLEGLPVAPFMDREKVTKPSSQIGFIKFVLLPLFEALGQLFPVIQGDIIEPVRKALDYYTDMQKALEEEKKRKESVAEEKKRRESVGSKMPNKHNERKDSAKTHHNQSNGKADLSERQNGSVLPSEKRNGSANSARKNKIK